MDDQVDQWLADQTRPAVAPEPTVLRFVEGELQRPKVSPLYRLSVVLVAAAMVLLPFLYGLLVIGVGSGVVYYARHGLVVLEWPLPGIFGILLRLCFYTGPLLAGSVLVLFLIKPLFAPARAEEAPMPLNHADAPQLFVLLGWICRSLDAPIPSRIDMTCGVNAAVSFRGGWRSLFGNDVALTIGLPLVAGLDLSQFAAVLAHEYGHFSQGVAMRASYVIWLIPDWFHRLVNESYAWDDALEEAADGATGLLEGMLFFGIRLGLTAGRGVLWLFLLAGGLLSSFMSRQMEFNADSYAMRMSGSQTFITTTRRVRQLGLGAVIARQQLQAKWKSERKLFDQIPAFIVSRADEIPAETQDQFYANVFGRKTGWWDAHPADAERLQRAAAAREPGIFHPRDPASSLFVDFPGLSRRITIAHYQRICGPGFSPEWLLPVEPAAIPSPGDFPDSWAAVQRYFLGVATPLRPRVIAESKALTFRGPETLLPEMAAARARMTDLLPAAREALAQFMDQHQRWLLAGQAAGLLQAGFAFDPADFAVADLDPAQVVATSAAMLAAAAADLAPFEDAVLTRLQDSLQLLRLPQCAPRIAGATKLQEEARELNWALTHLEPALLLLPELGFACATLEALLRYRDGHPPAGNLRAELELAGRRVQSAVNRMREITGLIRHPFPGGDEATRVSDYLRNRDYHPDPDEQVLREGQSHATKLRSLAGRLLGRLVMVAETVEAALPA